MVSLRISIPDQTLTLLEEGGGTLAVYPVSTALNGAGEVSGSECTPRGKHRIAARIGAGEPLNTIFVGRQPVGVWTPKLEQAEPGRDFILSRILWLAGCEPGFNQTGDVDTLSRYIYIHGTPDTRPMGQPLSHGCIRMRNADVMELFERVEEGTPVLILG